MKNVEDWKPGRFDVRNGKLCISKNPQELGIASRLVTGIVADAYNKHFLQHCRGCLLDLGCGKVPLFKFYRDHVDDIVCVDWGNTLHGGRHVDIRCDLSQELPLTDNEFDTILLSDVLEHLPNPQLVMNEIARVLRPKGKLIMNVPFLYWLHEVPHDYYRYTEHALRHLADESGLEVIVLEPLGGPWVVVADVIAKRAMRLPWLGPQLAKLVQGACLASVRRLVKRRGEATAARLFPSEYFMIAQKR